MYAARFAGPVLFRVLADDAGRADVRLPSDAWVIVEASGFARALVWDWDAGETDVAERLDQLSSP